MSTVWFGARHLKAADLQRRAEQAAKGLESMGVKAGDGVALYLRNDFTFFEVSIAAAMLGAYSVAVNWHYSPDEAAYLFTDSAAKVLVIHADLLEPIRRVIPDHVIIFVVPVPEEIRAAYGLSAASVKMTSDAIDWETWRDGFAPRVGPSAVMPSAIIYTSGTTGRPKGVKRSTPTPSEAQVITRMLALSYGCADYMDRPEEIVTAVVGPIYHSAPSAHASFAFRIRANVVIMPRFDAEELLRLIERRRITHLNMVPIMFNRLLKLPEAVRRQYDLSSLRFVVHAAAPISPPIKRAMIEWWGPVINEYYGATEMGNVTFCTTQEWLAHPGTVGRVAPGAEVKVIGPDGAALPPREVGEVIGRMRGTPEFTYQNDHAKRLAMEKQGLITPGDIGYFDEDGFLYLCDRKNDMIISGGVNIYPAEIEAELHKMPAVADCAIFGIPDEDFGEAVCAVVQPQPGASLDEAAVKAYLRGRVAGYKVPKTVTFSDALPREDSGKIFKRKLREPYWAGTGRSI